MLNVCGLHNLKKLNLYACTQTHPNAPKRTTHTNVLKFPQLWRPYDHGAAALSRRHERDERGTSHSTVAYRHFRSALLFHAEHWRGAPHAAASLSCCSSETFVRTLFPNQGPQRGERAKNVAIEFVNELKN